MHNVTLGSIHTFHVTQLSSKPNATGGPKDNDKENVPLVINYAALCSPEDVVNRNQSLLTRSKLRTLAKKLAREAYFGPNILEKCTVKGIGPYRALPKKELNDLKMYLKHLSVPRIVNTVIEFETEWKNCLESVGQACKSLRTKN